jgi:nitroimidazol reductase NimA-like FMN-containing flavoprotein (pyridoxamine 5'-phosphate oxidase superfamily)
MRYIPMTMEEIKSILKTNPLGRSATADKNGQPHVVPIGIFSDGDNIFIHTGANTKKAKNMMENPKVSLVVDYYLKTPRLEAGFVINGTARRLEKPEEIERARSMMMRASEGRPSHPDPKRPTLLRVSGEQLRERGRMPALFEIKIDKITSWKRSELTF